MAQLARRAEASESLAFRRAGDLDRRGPPRNDLDATAASAAAAAAAAAETQKMLREVVASIVGMEYRATDAQGRTEATMRLFDRLYTAVNRAHWEQLRRRSSIAPTVSPGAPGPFEAKLRAVAVGRSAKQFQVDAPVDPLAGVPCEPRRLLMFLLNLGKARPLFRKRIECTAQMLVQVSTFCREAARADAFITAKLGASKEPGQAKDLLSYAFVSQLRWACWDAAWHWVFARQGEDTLCYHHLQEWIKREHSLKFLAEVPQEVLGKLLLAAWKASQHTAFERYPEGPRSWGAWLRGAIRGGEGQSEHKEEFFALFDAMQREGVLAEGLVVELRWMLWNMAWYVAGRSKGHARRARVALLRVERHLHRAFRGDIRWRGVNLGGWFLLEPGPSGEFWEALPPDARSSTCEWSCCEALGPEAPQLVAQHRRSYFKKRDFEEIQAAGLSHVRLPIGAWCVLGPRPGEPFVGPCLEDLDRAMDLIEAEGLRVVLDLRGGVGGQNAERQCGHEQLEWRPRMWDVEACLEALRVLCERYAGRACVCGVGVLGEPSMDIPGAELSRYCEAAVEVVRRAGMRAGEVTVLLPVFPELRAAEVLDLWDASYPRYEDCTFDVHLYQWRGAYWETKSLAGHMQAAAHRATLIGRMPTCCVSEWCLALPKLAMSSAGEDEARDICADFARLQLEAFEVATHGWFFWTWKDSTGIQRSLRTCLAKGVLKIPSGSSRSLDTRHDV